MKFDVNVISNIFGIVSIYQQTTLTAEQKIESEERKGVEQDFDPSSCYHDRSFTTKGLLLHSIRNYLQESQGDP
jgi:hypothetical protein